MRARILLVEDARCEGEIHELLARGYGVVHAIAYQREGSPEEVPVEIFDPESGEDRTCHFTRLGWSDVTDELLTTINAVLMDGNLVGWRPDGASEDTNGVELTKELRKRGFRGKIFGRSADFDLNMAMIKEGADGESAIFEPSRTLNRFFPVDHSTAP